MRKELDNLRELSFKDLILLSNLHDLTIEEKIVIDNEFNRRIDDYIDTFGDCGDKYHL